MGHFEKSKNHQLAYRYCGNARSVHYSVSTFSFEKAIGDFEATADRFERLFVLRTSVGFSIFGFVSQEAEELLGFARDGVAFLTTPAIAANTYFFFSVLPAIIFFVSFVSILFYWGILQWIIIKAAAFFFWSMRVSGAEAVVAAASPFIGQGESAMLIKPFVPHLTMAELHQVMCSGFATIAGSVLVAYIALGVNGEALISSCVMSIPASLAIS